MDSDQILIDKFIRDHPSSAIHTLEKLKEEEVASFINNIPLELSVQIMNRMLSYKAAKCLELINLQLAVQILEKMDVHAGEFLLRQCKEDFRNNMLNALPAKPGAVMRKTLAHKDNSIGAYMKTMIVSLRKNNSVQEAIAALKQGKEQLSSQIYAVDEKGKLEGIVKIHDLLTEENSTKLSSIIIVDFPKFFADTDIESVANNPAWYEFQDIPVIDSSERLIGSLNIKSLRKNNNGNSKEVTNDLIETSNALGELYRIGLTGFLQSVSK